MGTGFRIRHETADRGFKVRLADEVAFRPANEEHILTGLIDRPPRCADALDGHWEVDEPPAIAVLDRQPRNPRTDRHQNVSEYALGVVGVAAFKVCGKSAAAQSIRRWPSVSS